MLRAEAPLTELMARAAKFYREQLKASFTQGHRLPQGPRRHR
jgi:hypothetical protein